MKFKFCIFHKWKIRRNVLLDMSPLSTFLYFKYKEKYCEKCNKISHKFNIVSISRKEYDELNKKIIRKLKLQKLQKYEI